jgi:hypothetical protein
MSFLLANDPSLLGDLGTSSRREPESQPELKGPIGLVSDTRFSAKHVVENLVG